MVGNIFSGGGKDDVKRSGGRGNVLMAGSGKMLNLESLGNYVGEYTPPTLEGYVFA